MKEGLRASAAYYNQVWARDSFISFLGANTLLDEDLLACARSNVLTFSKTSSPLGQIANFYDLTTKRAEYGFSGSTDSSCWYIIGVASLYAATDDRALLRGPLDAAISAYRWLRFQDANNTWLIDSPPGADWMDAAIQRTGKTLYNNALFLMATRAITWLSSRSPARRKNEYSLGYDALRQRFLDVFLPEPESPRRVARYWPRQAASMEGRLRGFRRDHFLHYVSFHRMDRTFDTLSNLLCVLGGLSERRTSRSILNFMRRNALSKPFPSKVLYPPYRAEGANYDTEFDSTIPPQHRSRPLEYHNGAVWPFVGGFYVCALNSTGADGAQAELESLARANFVYKKGEKTGFNEWLHGKTGVALGQYGQSWNAGMYVAAFHSAKGRGPLEFLDR